MSGDDRQQPYYDDTQNVKKGQGSLDGIDEQKLFEAVKFALGMLRGNENVVSSQPQEPFPYVDETPEVEIQEIKTNIQNELNKIVQALRPQDVKVIDQYAIRKAMTIEDYSQLHAPFFDPKIVSLALSVRPYLAKQGKGNLVDLFLKILTAITLVDDLKRTTGLFKSK